MTGLILFVSAVFVLQVILFILARKKRRQEQENSVIHKYNIKTSGDAFRLLQDPEIPEEDRDKIQELYNGKE